MKETDVVHVLKEFGERITDIVLEKQKVDMPVQIAKEIREGFTDIF